MSNSSDIANTEQQDNFKAEGAEDCLRWIEIKIREANERLIASQKAGGKHVLADATRWQARMETLVMVKVGLEKYIEARRNKVNQGTAWDDELNNTVI